jgi:hypothetical protein
MTVWQAHVDGKEERLGDVTMLFVISADFTNTKFTETIRSFNLSTFMLPES